MSPLLTAEPGTVAELHSFAREFKQRRARLGCTQTEVGRALGRLFGHATSQATVCRFEGLNMRVHNMCRLRAEMLTNRLNRSNTISKKVLVLPCFLSCHV